MVEADTVAEGASLTRALVTGANGFLGSAVVRALVADGVAVRALVRAGSDRRNLEGLGAELATGDITDRDSVFEAAAGCSAVFHVAADYRLWVAEPEPMYRANVEGSVNVLEAAAAAGASRMVYTSSVAVLGINQDRTPADEDTPVTVNDMVGHYKRSKFLAEQAVRQRARELGFPVVTVNPSTPIGPRDIKPTPTGRILLDAAAGRMPAFVDTGLNLVHVDDVAQGHLAALKIGAPDERYILGGDDFTLQRILELVAEHVGRRASTIRLPHWSVYPIALAAEGLARFTKREPRVTLDGVRMSTKHMYFSSRKAQRELGYRWRDPRLGLTEAVDWFKANDYF
jgi:dihydroflavonol-4-reductase